MAKNRKLKQKEKLSNNRETTHGRNRIQIIYSEPKQILTSKYLTKKGRTLLDLGLISKKEAWEKYGKNRYKINPNAKPIKVIKHYIF